MAGIAWDSGPNQGEDCCVASRIQSAVSSQPQVHQGLRTPFLFERGQLSLLYFLLVTPQLFIQEVSTVSFMQEQPFTLLEWSALHKWLLFQCESIYIKARMIMVCKPNHAFLFPLQSLEESWSPVHSIHLLHKGLSQCAHPTYFTYSLCEHHIAKKTWTLCLENGNNELLICWLSVFEKRKSLKTFCILKQFGWSFLLLFFLFFYISLQALCVYSLGHWQYKLDFQSERKLAFLGEVSKSPEEDKSNLSGIWSLWCQTDEPMAELGHR